MAICHDFELLVLLIYFTIPPVPIPELGVLVSWIHKEFAVYLDIN